MNTSQAWRPFADMATLRRRAELLSRLRDWFAQRNVVEVETPLLGVATSTDPNLSSVPAVLGAPLGSQGTRRFLQTSPEHHMKRLLAAGSGPIFQLCKAFRDGEQGRLHNPEFTMLEWYEPGIDHHVLMQGVEDMLRDIVASSPARRVSYGDLFEEYAGFDPLRVDDAQLRDRAKSLGAVSGLERSACLDLVLSAAIQPRLSGLLFVYDFPAEQAGLARIRAGNPPVAERFEVFVDGVELANGYHELTDANEQRQRFAADNARRAERGLAQIPVDERLLAALEAGLPRCAGVAIGIDRLIMLAVGAQDIRRVLAFPFSRA